MEQFPTNTERPVSQEGERTRTTIDLKGVNKAAVLAALYNASKPQGMGFLHYDPKPMTKKEAKKLLKHQTDFDYLQGRVMKVNLDGDTLNTWGYDRDNGEGAARVAIDSLLQTKKVNNQTIAKTHADNTFLSAVSVESHLDEETNMSVGQRDVVVNLGLKDVKDILGPKVKAAKDINKSK